jgi:antitoxin MazE
MVGKVQKWGNSLALRIPKAMADDLRLGEHAVVSMTLENGSLVVRPDRKKQLDLSDLLDRISPENVHVEVDWGVEAGNEVIL